MDAINRRRFLVTVSAAAATLPHLTLAQDAAEPVTLTIHPNQPGAKIPENFVGLSYEIQQLSDPSFFSPKNTGLIAMFKALAPKGVLRLGGNTSDVGWWKPKPDMQRPQWPEHVTATQATINLSYAVTPEAVRNLHGFLNATNWTSLYGINLGTNTPERATEEAVYVAKTLGSRLEYFQLGNEPDQFGRRLRDAKSWNVDTYLDEWLAQADAIRAKVPHAKFGLPDTAGNPQWSARIAERLSALAPSQRPQVAAISHHYYFGGPPSNAQINLERLLQPSPGVFKTAATTREAAEKLGVVYRMTEGNTCYQGGKPGVSDVFGAALWAVDYMLLLASQGYAGVNLHGGGGKEVANSLGGKLPGEELMPDPSSPHPRPFYTPIAYVDGRYVAEPVYYGMELAQRFSGATMLEMDFLPGSVNATAYAARGQNGKLIVAVINKDEKQALNLNIPDYKNGASVEILRGQSLTSNEATFSKAGPRRSSAGTGLVDTVPVATAVIYYSL